MPKAGVEKMVQCSNHYDRPDSLEEPPEAELELVRKVVEIGGRLFNGKSHYVWRSVSPLVLACWRGLALHGERD